MKYFSTTIATIAMIALTACGSTKNIKTNINSAEVPITQANISEPPAHDQIIAHALKDWSSMQCGGSMTIGGPKSITSSINMRMECGKSILISLRPLLGIEVGRMVITGDTLLVIDKLHKQYICENVSLLTNGFPVNVSTLQDIFLGRPFILDKGTFSNQHLIDVQVTHNDNEYKLVPVNKQQKFDYEFNFDKQYKIKNLCVTPTGQSQSTNYKVDYSEVTNTEAGNIAHKLYLETMIKNTSLSLNVNYNEITWNQSVKIDTSIPQGYKRVDARNLASILSGS